jgi:3-dehydroquinate synthase
LQAGEPLRRAGGLLERVRVELGERSYEIAIGPGLIAMAGELLRQALAHLIPQSGVSVPVAGRRLFVVSDTRVDRLHGARLKESLAAAGFRVSTAAIPPGERQKSLASLGRLCGAMLNAGVERGDALVALGGGVIGDLAGFAAAVYMRGIDFVQVPTTLLACVDSSVGGKTAVNLPASKNCVGAFHQPRLVVADIDALRTLSARDLRAGAAELVKHGAILDPELFCRLRRDVHRLLALDAEFTTWALVRSCQIKARVVTQDEREGGLRAVLNFGHTVGHAVEAGAGYGRYRHGEAVSIGMVAEALLAERIGFAQEPVVQPLRDLLQSMRLPTSLPAGLDIDLLMASMHTDKKTRGGRLNIVLPKRIGHVETVPLEDESPLRSVLCSLCG